MSLKMSTGILIAIVLNLEINLGKTDILIFTLRLPDHDVNDSTFI